MKTGAELHIEEKDNFSLALAKNESQVIGKKNL
jgi:hypothetical protein